MTDRETLAVSVTVRNIGNRAGKEIVQVYVSDREGSVVRPVKELKGFAKIALESGQAGTVRIELGRRAFARWSVEESRWVVESGSFDILAGPSSAELPLRASVDVRRVDEPPRRYTRNSTLAECLTHPRGPELMGEILSAAAGRFALKEGTSRYESTLAGLPLRYALSFLGTFGEEDLQALLGELNR
jgi:beta-glucosidase